MDSSMPAAKKRCWTLLLENIRKSNAKESDVVPSFRKRYTSARKVSFRSPTAHEMNDTTGRGIEGGILSVDLQFTGPQPIEGPAGLLCKLLQASLVAARPVQLGRGRKRKVRAGAAPPTAPAFASTSSSDSSGSNGTTSSATASSLLRFGSSPSWNNNNGTIRGSIGSSTGASTRTSRPMAEARESSGSKGTSGSGSGRPSNASTSSLADTTASEYSAKKPLIRLPRSWQEPETSRGGSSAAFSSAFGGSSLETESPVGCAANVDDSSNIVYTFPAPARLRRSCSLMTAAKDDLPALDGVVCGFDTRSASSCSSNEDEHHPSLNHSKGKFNSSTSPYTDMTANFMSLPPAAPGPAAGNSYYGCKEDMMTSRDAESRLGTSTAATSGGTAAAAAAAGGSAEGGLLGMIPDDGDHGDTFSPGAALGHRSSSCSALLPVHAGSSRTASDDSGGVGIGAGAHSDERRVIATETVVGGKPKTREHDVSFAWSEEECDFEGWPSVPPSSLEENFDSRGNQYPFTFHGLQSAAQGYGLHDLVFRAQFFADAKESNVAQRVANLFEADASGRAHANTTYPSIQEIWPEAYSMISITAIEVNMIVEIWSRDGGFVLTGSTLKVMYRRP